MWLVKYHAGTCAVRGNKRPAEGRDVVRASCGSVVSVALGVLEGDAPTCRGCLRAVRFRKEEREIRACSKRHREPEYPPSDGTCVDCREPMGRSESALRAQRKLPPDRRRCVKCATRANMTKPGVRVTCPRRAEA